MPPRKPSILKQRGIRLPETSRPGFDKLSPEDQAAAAARDVAHFIRSLRELQAARARAQASLSLSALDRRLRVLELALSWLLGRLGLDLGGADPLGRPDVGPFDPP